MKHTRKDYDRFQDPLSENEGGIPADEPVFLLRAKDKVAAATVGHWAKMALLAGASDEIIKSAINQAERMAAWPVKQVPDMPEA